ncbi:gamma-glutamylcyclotransferase [Rhodoferax sediminis]|uniref:glutathione-specific gamma-glutamylcyclotransferase n=1 Tax=Rhodoferax sediminis TaxID=2509614 RepID=A0A515DDF0_9BURK|nr:gamma-glutamylcyclotransferase [Rhodoferax sediminis]QDL38415.1 gamma-glutamylcyclotransferase [Rhodoferax sediminis]
MTEPLMPVRDPGPMLEQVLAAWGGRSDLWIFGYASLIWRPDFEFAEQRAARVQGWHRALKMWSRVNRGTPEYPGLVFALLSGGSCQGVAFRVHRHEASEVLSRLWLREMVTGVYDPRWLHCRTPQGPIRSLAFTLSRHSPSFTGELTPAQYRQVFTQSCGRYGTTHDYAHQTLHSLRAQGIHDRALQRLLELAGAPAAPPK